jgi:hypothetical protein
MPTLSRWNGCRFFFYSADCDEPPHVHVVTGEHEAKVWLSNCSVAINLGFPDLGDVIRKIREGPDASWRLGRTILHIEIEDARPVAVQCNDRHLIVTLADGRVVQTPVWWYPRLLAATAEQRSQVELSPLGIHWPQLDEDIRVTSILRGMKAPGATEPDKPEPTDPR